MAFTNRAHDNPERRRFARAMREALRRAGETRPIRRDAAAFALLIGDRGDHRATLNLGNAYDEYRAAPRHRRPALLARYARSTQIGRPPASLEEVRPALLPLVRERYAFSGPNYRPGGDGWPVGGPPPDLVGEHLAVGLAWDCPEVIMNVPEELLAKWGVSAQEASAIARHNLRHRSGGRFLSPAPGVFISPWRDCHDASRLVLTDLIRDHEVRGDYVAMAPNRDTLLVTGSEDRPGLEVMLRLAQVAWAQPRRLSGIPVRLCEGGWVPFSPDASHPGLQGFKSLRLESLGGIYRAQKGRLDRAHEREDRGIFVSDYLIAQERSGAVHSIGCWTEGVPTLLPRVDIVAFVMKARPGQRRLGAAARWERVQEVVGDLMTPTQLYPERFRVEQFPTSGQLRALGLEAFEALSAPVH
jgi:hypothetical protein